MSPPTTPPTTKTLEPPFLIQKSPAELKKITVTSLCREVDGLAHQVYVARTKVDRLMKEWFQSKKEIKEYVDMHMDKPYYEELDNHSRS
jgi:hypothetical protein